MVDAHYDLLSICYVCYLKNDYTKIEEISKKIKNNNIKCIFASLYFMSIDEMQEELHENYYNPEVSILTMFKISKQILEKSKEVPAKKARGESGKISSKSESTSPPLYIRKKDNVLLST